MRDGEREVRERYDGLLVCEPRHPSWFAPEVDALLVSFRVARVAADPAGVADAAVPGGWPHLAYFRLHGSPRMYWSAYEAPFIDALEATVRRLSGTTRVWCVFDNTAMGAATEHAVELSTRLRTARSMKKR